MPEPGDNAVDLDNVVTDSLVITKAEVRFSRPWPSPRWARLPPECVVLAAELFAGGSADVLHVASQWQVATDINVLSAPIADVWERHPGNVYFNEIA